MTNGAEGMDPTTSETLQNFQSQESSSPGESYAEQALEKLKDKLHIFLGRAGLSFYQPLSVEGPLIMSMARGGNFKVQRINLQNSGKLNSKKPMPPEQKRLRKRKRKK